MKKIGVIVARFQVPELHDGHVDLIRSAAKNSDVVIVFLGYKINQPDIKNPFSFKIREAMLYQAIANAGIKTEVIVDSIADHPDSNEAWSHELDRRIGEYKKKLLANNEGDVHLYGSRDSFAKCYFGTYPVVLIDQTVSMSGTEVRNKILRLKEEELTKAHREGIIYGLKQIYPVGMSVIDILIYKKVDIEYYILLGKKQAEGELRILGGFFDVEKDKSLEDTALRELREEAGDVEVENLTYVTSSLIDDWRYRDNQHKIVSSLFIAKYVKGECKPNDDIEELVWVNINDLKSTSIIKSHQYFIEKAVTRITNL